MRCWLSITWLVFPPEAREDSTVISNPILSPFWRIPSSDWFREEQLFYSCMPWGGREGLTEGGSEGGRKDFVLSLSSVYLCVGWRHTVGCGERDLLCYVNIWFDVISFCGEFNTVSVVMERAVCLFFHLQWQWGNLMSFFLSLYVMILVM